MTKHALIVDDSLVARISIKSALRGTDFETEELDSGDAALERLGRGDLPELVFLDLTMPGRDGLSTLRIIRERWPKLPVIVVTADIQKHTLKSVRELGASDILPKPIDRQALHALLGRLFDGGEAEGA